MRPGDLALEDRVVPANVLIDNFSVGQLVQIGAASPQVLTGSVADPSGTNVVQVDREVEVTKNAGGSGFFATFNASGGFATFSTDFGVTGVTKLVWDGQPGGDVIGTVNNGFSPVVNLSGTGRIAVNAGSDLGSDIRITLYNGANAFAQTQSVPSGGVALSLIGFDYPAFTRVAGVGTLNLSSITAITLEIISTRAAADTTLDFVIAQETSDLSLTKTRVTPFTPAVGDLVQFSLTVTNGGTTSTSNILVSDPLPAGLQFVSQDSAVGTSGTYDGTTWTLPGTLAVGSSVTVNYTARVVASGSITNSAEIGTADGFDPDSTPGNGSTNEDDDASVTFTANAVDFGDAPTAAQSGFAGSYPTTLADNGARHVNSGLQLRPTGGTTRDTENNGQPTANADGDDLANADDENGVTLPATGLARGSVQTISADVTGGSGRLNAWIDFNRDGDWDDPGEQVLTDASVVLGSNTLSFTIPAGASLGTTYARFRLNTPGGLTPRGLASDGEVEDYRVALIEPADIEVTKGVDDATPNLGDTVTFTIDATNIGPNNATGVTLSDLVNTAQFSITGTSATQGSYVSGSGVWLIGSLANGASASLTITARVVASGSLSNTATVTVVAPGDSDPSNDSDTVSLAVAAQDFGDAPNTYGTSLAGNGARHIATGPILGATRDTDNDGAPNGTATGDGGDEDGVSLPTGGTLLIGQNNTVTIAGTPGAFVDAWIDLDRNGVFDATDRITPAGGIVIPASGTLTLTVNPAFATSVAGDTFARFRVSSAGGLNPTGLANGGEVEDYAVRLAQQADLSLTKTLDTAAPYLLGDTVTFTLTVTNAAASPSPASGVTVSDPLPAGLAFVSQTVGTGAYNGTTWTIPGTIAPGASVSVTYTARIVSSGAGQANYAQIQTANEFDPDSTPGDNSGRGQGGDPPSQDDNATATYNVPAEDFGDAPTAAQSGFPSSYPVTLAQNGARHIATGLTLGATRDGENDGQPDATATGDGADEDGAAGIATLTQGVNNAITVTPSAAGFLSLWIDWNRDGDWDDAGEQVFNATPVASGSNSLTVNPGLFPSTSFTTFARFRLATTPGDIATPTGLAGDGEVEDYQVTVRQVADLDLVKSATPGTVTPGETVTFTVTVTNTGPNTATGVTVSDILPPGLTTITQTGGGGTFLVSGSTLTWTPPGGTIGVGAGNAVTLTYTAVATQSGSFLNYAQVATADQFDPDSQPGNGTFPPSQDDEDDAPYTVASVDFGDAPDPSYPTRLAQDGARHVATGPTLGATRDGENNGQPNAAATGDGTDEDGVTIAGPFTQGVSTNSFTVVASAPGFLNVWIDLNHDGDWDDVGERVATNLAVAAGPNTVPFAAPLDPALVTFDTYARFRLTSASVTTPVPTGVLPDGEVEDYRITLRQVIDLSVTKTVDNPTPALGTNLVYTITLTNAGPNTATNVTATDVLPAGVTYVSDDSGTTGTGYSNATGVWTVGSLGSGSSIVLRLTVLAASAGSYNNFVQVTTADQFDVDSQPNNGAPPTPAQDDEAVAAITIPPADFGDAPTAAQSGFAGSYPTTLAQNGARHGIGGPTLGTLRDAENDGLPTLGAVGDDANNTDDEDGIASLNATIGTNQTIQVNASGSGFLNAWIDFNQDGDWDDPGEQVFTNTPVFAGSNFPVVPLIPLTATPGNTYARFRLTSATVTTPSPRGTLPDGEVEDYPITVQRIADYGDAPDTYGTTVGSNGAGHIALGVGPFLGAIRPDPDADGVPTVGADGDDAAGADDEDGVTIPNLFAGQPAAFTINAPLGGRLDAFIDWNGDGDFTDAGERVTAAGGTLLTAGANTFTVAVPANFVGGPSTYLRFRVSTAGGLSPTGLAADGEVEDYRYTNSSISGRTYIDNRLTGFTDAGVGSPPLAGVTINLLDGTGTFITSTTTAADGTYLFPNLAPGNYQVQEVQPTGGNFFEGFDTAGSTGGTAVLPGVAGHNFITGITLPIGTNSVGNNFGEIPPADPNGFVYNDLNANGLRDPGEPGIPGVTIRISGTAFAGTPIARPVVDADIPGGGLTRSTDANGFYEYAIMPPGVYAITEGANPPGFIDGSEQNADTVGPNTVVVGNDNFSNIFLAPNPIRGPFNFGEVLPASVSGAVYQDGNRNGVRDAGDQPIAGVVITLTGTDFLGNPVGPITTTTDANGNFSFAGVRPGTYNVAEAQPQNFSQGTNAAGSAGGILVATDIFGQVVLGSGTIATNYLFGEVNPLGTTPEPVPPPGPLPPLTTVAPGGVSKRSFLSSTGAATITGPFDPDYNALGSLVAGANRFLSTSEGEGGELVRTFDLGRGQERFRFRPFPGNPGGVRAETADITGDGVPETIAVPGPGTGARLIAYNGNNGAIVQNLQPFESTFTGGMFVAAGDFNGDGVADLVVSADVGGGPRVKVIDGATGAALADFMGIDDASFRGGARVAVGDINGDGIADLVVAAGFGGGPRVAVFDGASVAAGNPTRLAPDFFAFERTLRNGVFVAVGDIDGDGFGEIITGAGPGGGPRVLGFSGTSLFGGQPTIITDFFAGDQSQRGGVPVSALDVNTDGRVEVITGSAPGGPASVKFFNPQTGAQLNEFFAERGDFLGGVFVG